jgi:hypothetical protein
MTRGLEDRTDNTYLPNTPKGWASFRWHLNFYGGHVLVLATHYMNMERHSRKDKQKELEEGKDV